MRNEFLIEFPNLQLLLKIVNHVNVNIFRNITFNFQLIDGQEEDQGIDIKKAYHIFKNHT